jgi:hypothetical protein
LKGAISSCSYASMPAVRATNKRPGMQTVKDKVHGLRRAACTISTQCCAALSAAKAKGQSLHSGRLVLMQHTKTSTSKHAERASLLLPTVSPCHEHANLHACQ